MKIENDLDLLHDFSQKDQIKDQDHENDLDHCSDQIIIKKMILSLSRSDHFAKNDLNHEKDHDHLNLLDLLDQRS